ncbi:MAG: phosphatase PAP2 family protein, partial [Burkholderiaceae bacterium]
MQLSTIRLSLFAVVPGLAALALTRWDTQLFLWIQAHATRNVDPLWSAITIIGTAAGIIALLSPIWRRHPGLGPAIVLSAVICTLIVQLFKRLTELSRPLAVLGSDAVHVIGIPLYGRAFPSGHSAAAFAAAAVLIASGVAGRRSSVLLLIGATLIALSRIVTGAHWPSDVFGGAAVGWLCGLAGYWIASRLPHAVHRGLEWFAGIVAFACGLVLVFGDADYPLAIGFQLALGTLA